MSKREARREPTDPTEDGREPLIRQAADGVRIENEDLLAKLAQLRPEWRRHLQLSVAELIQGGTESAEAEVKVFRKYKDLNPKITVVPVGLDIIEATREEGEIVLSTRTSDAFDEIRGYLQSLMD